MDLQTHKDKRTSFNFWILTMDSLNLPSLWFNRKPGATEMAWLLLKVHSTNLDLILDLVTVSVSPRNTI